MRQTWEEIGIDLAEKYYSSIGQLDDAKSQLPSENVSS